jgi:nucleotide-binding universal stress UspA family protein
MTTDRPVVAGVDGSASSLAAAATAGHAALVRGTSLDLVHGYLHLRGYGAVPLDPYAATVPAPPEAGQRMLDEVAAGVRAAYPGLEVRTRQVAGGPAATLVELSHHAELVVVGRRGLGGFAGLVLGSVSAQVAAHAHCPVLVARPQDEDENGADDRDGAADDRDGTADDRDGTADDRDGAAQGRTGGPAASAVLVGVDFSPGTEAALAEAAAEAARRRAELVVAHVWWNHPFDTLADPGGDVVAAAEREARRQLAEAVAHTRRAHPELTVSPRLVHSLNPEHSLIEASRDAALVVVGSRGRGGFAGLLLGSVGQSLVHHARCPVMVVHPRSHRG